MENAIFFSAVFTMEVYGIGLSGFSLLGQYIVIRLSGKMGILRWRIVATSDEF